MHVLNAGLKRCLRVPFCYTQQLFQIVEQNMAVKITGDVDVYDAAEGKDKRLRLNGRLLGAARTGDVKLAGELLDQGAQINVTGEEGYTPLHEAIRANRRLVAAMLVERGASLVLREDKGLTPFELAEKHNRTAVISEMQKALSLRRSAQLKALRRRLPHAQP